MELNNVGGQLQYQVETGGAQRLLYEFLHPDLKRLPARHRAGHIGDIDWHAFVHGAQTDCRRCSGSMNAEQVAIFPRSIFAVSASWNEVWPRRRSCKTVLS